MNRILIKSVPRGDEIPLEARQELVGQTVRFRGGGGPAHSEFCVDVCDLLEDIGEAPMLRNWIEDNIDFAVGATFLIETGVCQVI
ncbi:MAG: hypothetical protein KKE64_06630 [Candidatus Omnitrophica bacterium]|nr:hypothetical protein [Candidatus Omnitrophota bacterium]